MDRLLPAPPATDLALDELYRDLQLPSGPPGEDRAGVTLGMVTSVDGATALGGVSRGLGGEADGVAFDRLRGACDAILVGAGTARAEDYGPPGGSRARRERRTAAGLAPVPAMLVVTGSADLDPTGRLFTDPRRDADAPVVVVTCRAAPAARREALAEVAEVVELGDDEVDLVELVRWCRRRGFDRVLCEGGPGLNGRLADAGLVDELLLTLSPQLVAGSARRLLDGPVLDPARALLLTGVHAHGGDLLLRYRVRSAVASLPHGAGRGDGP